MKTTISIRVTGRDAKDFLQGQLSNDIDRLDKDPELLAAWCTPKGRVITLIGVTMDASGYRLHVPSTLGDNIIKRLTMYRFRAKVEFSVENGESMHNAAAAIVAGVPWIGHEQTEKFTPHMLNLDLLDAISLDKGCYTGQEIVARTHYQGATKRRTLRFESEQPVSVGDKVSLHGRDIGEVLNVAGNDLLAVVAVDKANETLSIGDTGLTRRSIPYLPN